MRDPNYLVYIFTSTCQLSFRAPPFTNITFHCQLCPSQNAIYLLLKMYCLLFSLSFSQFTSVPTVKNRTVLQSLGVKCHETENSIDFVARNQSVVVMQGGCSDGNMLNRGHAENSSDPKLAVTQNWSKKPTINSRFFCKTMSGVLELTKYNHTTDLSWESRLSVASLRKVFRIAISDCKSWFQWTKIFNSPQQFQLLFISPFIHFPIDV